MAAKIFFFFFSFFFLRKLSFHLGAGAPRLQTWKTKQKLLVKSGFDLGGTHNMGTAIFGFFHFYIIQKKANLTSLLKNSKSCSLAHS